MQDTQGLEAINQGYLGDVAYERISNAIISGAFRPGEKLTIRNLADLLEISSTPVRDAVKRLLLVGALEQRAPRDIRVPIITRERYREIADIRLELEGLGAARAAERRSESQLRMLEANVADNEDAVKAREWRRAIELNKQFHFALAEMSQMPTLVSILGGLWLQIGPPISAFYEFGGSSMIDHHHHVLDAIRKRQPEQARKHITRDIAGSMENIMAHIEESTAEQTR